MITFLGESVSEVMKAFHDSVDLYLDFCAKRGESLEKPYSGQFLLRVAPELHRELANAALAQATSLNALVETTLRNAFSPDDQERSRAGRRATPTLSTAKKPASTTKKSATRKTPRLSQ